MEVKNGIIIDGVLHEMANENIPCNLCSLLRICGKSENEEYAICLCTLMNCGGFVDRGRVKIEKMTISHPTHDHISRQR